MFEKSLETDNFISYTHTHTLTKFVFDKKVRAMFNVILSRTDLNLPPTSQAPSYSFSPLGQYAPKHFTISKGLAPRGPSRPMASMGQMFNLCFLQEIQE